MAVINSLYTRSVTLRKIREAFDGPVPSVQLQQFFTEEFYEKIVSEVNGTPFQKAVQPLQYSYARADGPSGLHSFFSSLEWKDFWFSLTGKKTDSPTLALYEFGWKDYTLLHDALVEKPGFDVIVDFTFDWNPDAGGAVRYVDGSGEFTTIACASNSLTIVRRNKNVQRFVQYVNHYAGMKRRMFALIQCL